MKNPVRKSLMGICVMLSILLSASNVFSQSCGCDRTLSAGSDGGIYAPNLSTVLPGQKICIPAGTYTYISLGKIKGSALAPITIVNCGGQVISNGTGGYGFRVVKSQYFRLTGTGTNGLQYGLKTFGLAPATPSGISIMDSTSDYEIDHMELQNVGVGIFTSKPPSDADSGTWKQGWVNKNLSYHDNYIHNAGGEAMYLGATSSSYTVLDYNGNSIVVEPILQNNVKIYNNIIDSAGWDGIQLASSPNSAIYDNVVMNFGLKNLPVQQAGIIFGGKCSGSVFNNYIYKGTGNGIQIFGYNNIKCYNNIVVDAGWDGTAVRQDGIIVDDRPFPSNIYSGLQIYLMNNTVVNSGNHAVRLYNSYGTMATGNKVLNNLLVKPNCTSIYDDPYLVIGGGLSVSAANNIRRATIAEVKFVNPTGNDYHLQPTSPAVDSGQNVTSYAITFDYDSVSRPYGVNYDAGAYELKTALPLQLLSFSVRKADNRTTILKWVTTNETGTSHFEILKGKQANALSSTGTVAALGNSNANHEYSFTDMSPFSGENYYQLKMIDRDGQYKYSQMLHINFDKTSQLNVYPNPVKNNEIYVSGENLSLTSAILIDISGKKINCDFVNNNSSIRISIPETLAKGMYNLQLSTEKGINNTMVLVQ